jgi:hypothetical protein
MVPREIYALQIMALLRRMFIVFKSGGTMRAGDHLPPRFWLISYPYSNHCSGADHAHHISTCPPRLPDFPPDLVLLRLIAACRQRILGGYGHWEENEWRYKDWPPQGRRKGMGRGGTSPLLRKVYINPNGHCGGEGGRLGLPYSLTTFRDVPPCLHQLGTETSINYISSVVSLLVT